MRNVYITNHNFKYIKRNNEGGIYEVPSELFKKYFFLDKSDVINLYDKYILASKNFGAEYAKYYYKVNTKEYFERMEKTYVKKVHPKCYHKDDNCERLLSAFNNIFVPIEIRLRGDDEIKRYKKWYNENSIILEAILLKGETFGDRIKLFLEEMYKEFNLKDMPNPADFDNSGSINFDHLSEEALKIAIENKRKAFEEFIEENKDYKQSIEYEELKEEMNALLYSYIIVKYKVKDGFNEELLKEIGFKCCSKCSLVKVENSTLSDIEGM
jgi:hypothetical protein